MTAETVVVVIVFGFIVLLTGGLLVQGYRDGTLRERDAELRRRRQQLPGASKAFFVLGGALLVVGGQVRYAEPSPWWMWASLPAAVAAMGTGFVLEGRARRRREAAAAQR